MGLLQGPGAKQLLRWQAVLKALSYNVGPKKFLLTSPSCPLAIG